MIYKKLLKHVQAAGYFDRHKKVLIAVSGGVDSMNLLHFLHTHQHELDIQIGLAHVNHHQRKEADDEEDYLKQWALQKEVACFISHFQGRFTEQSARQWRYDFFKETMKTHGYTALVTAHHQDDQVETILMRLIRGSRLRHLSGIPKVQSFGIGELIRPFLDLSKKELLDLYHFKDSSNDSLVFFRNRVRHQLLPQLEQENPKFPEAIVSLATEITHYRSALDELTQGLTVTDARVFLKQSSAVQAYLLETYLDSFPDLQLSKAQFLDVLKILKTQPRYYQPLKAGYFLKKTPQSIAITRIGPETDGAPIEKLLQYDDTVVYDNYVISLSSDLERNGIPIFSDHPILLRSRRAGDRIDFGSFRKKVSRLLIDDKVPVEARHRVIIGEQDHQILFVLTEQKTYLRKISENAIMKGKLYIQKE